MSQKPVPPGTIVGSVPKNKIQGSQAMTPLEQEVYRRAQIDPNAIPSLAESPAIASLSAQLEEVRDSASHLPEEERQRLLSMANLKPLQLPREVPVGSLGQQAQEEAKQLVAEYQMLEAAAARKPLGAAGRVPGVAEAIQVAEQPVVAQVGGVALVDDRVTPRPKKQTGNATIEQAAAARRVYEKAKQELEAAEAKAAANQEAAEESTDTPPAEKPPQLKVDDADKWSYLQLAILGGKRFEKSYSLFGNRLRVTFRSLTPQEEEWAMELAAKAVQPRSDLLAVSVLYARLLSHYRMFMAIRAFERAGSPPTTFKPVHEIMGDHDPLDVIQQNVVNYFKTSIFTSNSQLTVITQRFIEFENLVTYLDSKAAEPDFWPVIE